MPPEAWPVIRQIIDAVQAIVLAWLAYKASVLTRAMVTLEKQTNSIKDELVAVTKKSSHAEGVLDEKTRQEKES